MQNLYLTIAREEAKKGDIVIWIGLKIWDGTGSIPHHNRHIIITSDEEIKEGNYWYDGTNIRHDFTSHFIDGIDKKIILTTDPKLIAHGVQAISDDFKNWFIKNQSCVYVEVVGVWEQVDQSNPILYGSTNCFLKYKILTK